MAALHEIADALHNAQSDKIAISPIREQLDHTSTIHQAYQIQDLNTERALASGRRLVGKKIGLTSFAVQKQLGVDSPDFGMLFEDMAYVDGAKISLKQFIQPKVEAEIALVLKKSLDQRKHSIEDIIAATDYVVAAIEIVDSRIENWNISLLDTVADNASSAAFVLGKQRCDLKDIDLVNCTMQMKVQGEVVSQGQGKACLDHPLHAAVWLANEMAQRGRPLQAGDIVLTGALGPMVAVQAHQQYDVDIEGLGQVSVKFTA